MHCFRVTKYNPKYRDDNGIYLKNEWCFYGELNDVFEGEKLTFAKYLESENNYINAINLFMEDLGLENMYVSSLGKSPKPPKLSKRFNQEMLDAFNQAEKGLLVDRKLVLLLARLNLRDMVGCKLEAENMYIHFGWDFYMYIGTSKLCVTAIDKIEQSGLFVEPHTSYYINSHSIVIIKKDNKILILMQQNEDSETAKWEFPCQEDDPYSEENLKTSIFEDLGIQAEVNQYLNTGIFYFKNSFYELCILKVLSYKGEISLKKHSKMAWVNISELSDYVFSEDSLAIIEYLKPTHFS